MEEKELKRLFDLAHFGEADPDEKWLSNALDEALKECAPLKTKTKNTEKAMQRARLRDDGVKDSVLRARLIEGGVLTLPEEENIF